MARALIFLSLLALLSLAVAPHSTSARKARVVQPAGVLASRQDAPASITADTSCATFEEVGSIPGHFSTVSVSGTLLYTGGETTFAIFDASNPVSPTLLGSFPLQEQAISHLVVGTLVYLLTLGPTNQKLLILDVSNPQAPTLRGTYPMPHSTTYAAGLDVSGHFAYIADGYQNTLLIVDVNDPSNPVLRTSYQIGSPVFDLQVVGNIAYVGTLGGLHILNVSDPLQPSELGRFLATDTTVSLDAVGNHVYAGGSGGPVGSGFSIFDVTDSAKPTLSGSFGFVYRGYSGIQYRGFLVYAAYASTKINVISGLDIINVLDPSNPRMCAEYQLSTTASDLDVVDNLAYVATGPGGVHILRVTQTIVFSHAFLPVVRR